MPFNVLRRTAALAALLMVLAVPALGYEDVIYRFRVDGPSQWLPLKQAVVPGLFRFGWLSNASVKDRSGANVVAFVQLFTSKPDPKQPDITAKDMLERNAADAARHGLKVVKQRLFKTGKAEGFVLEISGLGTGFSLIPKVPGEKQVQGKIPTRQRWYALVVDERMVGLMSTCAESNYGKYLPTFEKVEQSLTLR